MRKLPEALGSIDPRKLASPERGTVLLDAIVRAITPVLGGGVESFMPDGVDVVRVPSIRGAVRWWWRALHPELDRDALRAKEREIWGGVGKAEGDTKASRVRVTVRIVKPGSVVPAGRHASRAGGALKTLPDWAGGREYGYALFPLQRSKEERRGWPQNGGDMPTKPWRHDLEFRLRVEVAARGVGALTEGQRNEVRQAFEAWLTFGGYGARTRRGFGALHADGVSYAAARDAVVRARALGAPSPERPTLASCVLLEGPWLSRADEAHRELLGALQEFRQGTRFGRNPGQDKPFGRSNWPEADTLRAIAGKHEPRHAPRGVSAATGGAPRALFGLPLSIQFKDPGDQPADATLVPEAEGTQRWASPLLLRVTKQGNHFVPVVLLLEGHRPQSVRAVDSKKNERGKLPVLYGRNSKGAQGRVEQALLGAGGDALKAFGRWLREGRGYQCTAGALQ